MANYIIITRVLGEMSEEATKLWEHNTKKLGESKVSHKIEGSNITLFNGAGEKLDKVIWGKILDADGKLESKEMTSVKDVLIGDKKNETFIFVHFGGYNEENVKVPLEKLKTCFNGLKIEKTNKEGVKEMVDQVTIIPFTVQPNPSGILVSSDFLKADGEGDLKDKLKDIADNYKARESDFGWYLGYEKAILYGLPFNVEPKVSCDDVSYKKYLHNKEKIEHLREYQVKLPETKSLTEKIKYKIGTWDTERNAPKPAKRSDFEHFRKQIEKHFDKEMKIVFPREETFDAWLIIHTLESIKKTTVTTQSTNESSWITKNPKPILSVGLLPLWDYGKASFEEFRKNYLDPRIRFWDSCVWFRYVPLLDENWAINQKASVLNALNDIHSYHQNGIYNTISAREFLEFHLRVYKNAFVARTTKKEPRAHGGSVTPFSFHSETKIQQETTKIIDKLKGLQWRVLLIDDYGEADLRTVEGAKPLKKSVNTEGDPNAKKKYALTKKKYVEEALKDESFLDLECVKDFQEAYKCIEDEKKHYDIILLDYLFKKDEENKNEFGIDFLKGLLDKKNGKNIDYLEDKYLGPLKNHFIIPISVYQNALTDNLHDAAIMTHGPKWHITQGTDPLNKPYLFRYTILKLMKKQLEEVSFKKRDLFADLIDGDTKDLMNNAIKAYSSIVEKSNKLTNLIRFYDKSRFAKTLLDDEFKFHNNRDNLVHVGQHFQHLFTMITNGNTLYKSQMWDEYFWLKDKLVIGDSTRGDNTKFWTNIETYINGLKG
jgi:hypothetical protein